MNDIRNIGGIAQSFLEGTLSRTNFYPVFEQMVESNRQSGGQRLYIIDSILTNKNLSEDEFRSKCKELLIWCQKIEAGVDAENWISREIVEDEASFNFFDETGRSKFNEYKTLYRTDIKFSSFLMSALNGIIKPTEFSHELLVAVLREIEGDDNAAWAHCIEVDGLHAHISIYNGHMKTPLDGSLYWESAYENYLDEMNIVERTSMGDYQSCVSYYALIPKSRKWALVHGYFTNSFEIVLHGSHDLLHQVSGKINL